jgi:chorismate mutase/prephenate dehydratase
MRELFLQRMAAAKEVAEYKSANGLPILDEKREAAVIEKNASALENEDLKPFYVNFLEDTMAVSRRYQDMLISGMKVAYSGERGAFAYIAATNLFPNAKKIAYGNFEAAYAACVKGECDAVVLPIENSYNGEVGAVTDLMFSGPLHVNSVIDVDIAHCLLGVKGATVKDVKKVISHPQALGQCAAYIEKHGFETVEAVNTAVAAEMVAKAGETDIAAIASDEAALKFGLIKLEGHINESSNNTTRFVVFSRSRKAPSKKDDRFVMLFTVKNAAGSLGKAVSVIGEHGFNLRALKSRPTKELSWSYYFYAEGEGNINSDEGKAMMKELKKCCSNLKIVGSFEKEIKI